MKNKIILLLIVVVLLIIYYPQINSLYNQSDKIIINAGFYGAIVYMLLMIAAIIISPIPSAPLAIISGTIFGPLLGIVYTLVGATVGAVFAFLIARFSLRNWFAKKIKNNSLYLKIDGENGRNLTKIIFVSRLIPYISFDIISYAAGLTEISLLKFTLATFLGMIPIVFLEVYFGALIKPYLVILFTATFVVFVLVTIYQTLKLNDQ